MSRKSFFTLEQRRVKVDRAIDAAALGPFKKQAHGHGREKEKSSLFGCDFSAVSTISEGSQRGGEQKWGKGGKGKG